MGVEGTNTTLQCSGGTNYNIVQVVHKHYKEQGLYSVQTLHFVEIAQTLHFVESAQTLHLVSSAQTLYFVGVAQTPKRVGLKAQTIGEALTYVLVH